ncbi:putative ribonuclease H-like domain-containing protein [Tanacetum coccineum]|uniref:Ribonuclease H-like domain-containing protein n=1 Tax=Tanacetum coccineum TaxID=301880 RepID=A0ABQ5JA17_9ASTR
MQKTILKQQYENFTASRFEGLDKTYDRFQKLISQLEIHENTSSTNEAVNTTHDVSIASSQGQASSLTYADDVMFSLFANQSNSLQIDNEDLEQIDTDDLKEMDLKWKVECYNCHRRGPFARECKALRNQGNRNVDAPRRIVPVKTPANALVVQNGIDSELEEALKEKNDLKLKLENFEESLNNLTKLINSQISAKDKAGLGYDSQMNESEVVHSVFNNRECDVDDSLVNDRFKTSEGFHAVPPPYTGNCMLSRPDLSFVGLDDSVYKTKVSETITTVSKTSKDSLEKPKTIRHSAPIIEDWDTDSDNDSVFRPKTDQTKPKSTKINFVKLDETSEILKTFTTGIKNQINHKVKIIRCDNGTEFKNNDMNQFCRMKGIKKEFSVTKTPQQNGVVERKNRTLIEAANPLGKFDEKADEGFFVVYSINSKAFTKKGYANSTNRDNTISPSISTTRQNFTNADDLPIDPLMPDLEDTGIFSGINDDEDVGAEADLNNLETTMNVSPIPTTRIHKDHPKDQIIGDINSATQTRRMTKISEEHIMRLVDLRKGKHAIGTKWVYRNKKDERGIVVRNKARLVAQGYTQEEGIDYDKMDVKSAFLYGTIEEEVAWYETLSTYLFENGYRRGTIDKTLFIKKDRGDILLVHVYVDDIIYGSTKNQDKYVADILKKFDFTTVKAASTLIETNKALSKDEEAEDVNVHLYRSMIGSLMYLTASRPDIIFSICACARFQVTRKTSHLHAVKMIFRYLKRQPKLGLWYPRDSPFDLEAFFDSDYVGASLDRKSTTGGCQFLGKRLISWQCKKQTIVANSTTKAEYVAAANCCVQVLWI